jgi:hypothetical protein
MHYDFIAIPDADEPQAVDPVFQHVLATYASESTKTASVWRAVPDDLLDFKPHEKTTPIRTILVHQLLSERRFFAKFVGTEETPVEELLPPGDKPVVSACRGKYIWLVKHRLPQWAQDTAGWWLESRPFFGGLQREQIGASGGVSCASAITGRRCRPGCGWPARAGPGNLRAFRRREVGRGRPHLLPGGGEAGRLTPSRFTQAVARRIPRRFGLT